MTEQELNEYLQKISVGCDYCGKHPEQFKMTNNGFTLEIIDENVPEEAREYVNFINKRYEASKRKKETLRAMGIGGEMHADVPPRTIKWGRF